MTEAPAASERAEDGFTLIELLVVIIIIGILAAIAIPTFLGQRQRGYEASMKSDLRSIANEETSFLVDNDRYAAAADVNITAPNGIQRGQIVIFPGTAVAMSPFNVVQILQAGKFGFCLQMTNSHTARTYFYDSFGGGVTVTSCAAKPGY